jgi:hypothetical protein
MVFLEQFSLLDVNGSHSMRERVWLWPFAWRFNVERCGMTTKRVGEGKGKSNDNGKGNRRFLRFAAE